MQWVSLELWTVTVGEGFTCSLPTPLPTLYRLPAHFLLTDRSAVQIVKSAV